MRERPLLEEEGAEEIHRLASLSTDSDRVSEALRDPEARFVLFRGDDVLLKTDPPIRPALVSPGELANLTTDFRGAVFLGTHEAGPRLAIDLEEVCGRVCGRDAFLGEFQNLFGIQEPIDPQTWELLSRARALLAWNRLGAACPTCGAATKPQEGGTVRICSNATCGRIHYPRMDPTAIVRVVSDDKCLLARQPQYRPGLRSVLAGFVEPGETLEGAVRREVAEEVGIAVDRMVYLGSQPWPFPMSLMIAFEAHAQDEAIQIDRQELEAADWYTRERVQQELSTGSLVLPSKKSIARRMIEDWLEERD